MAQPGLGPALAATIITRDLDDSTGVYTGHLDQRMHAEAPIGPAEAAQIGWPELEGARSVWLANALGEPWLRLVEYAPAEPVPPVRRYGWLSLEIAVRDVDSLAQRLQGSPFEIIGPPRDLAMSDAIRAMQVVGPSGEVLYLTEVKRPVPPFELPVARCPVDRLFIPVMTCPDREAALAHYTALSGNEGLRFDTQITVISRALGLPENHAHPVATLQLAGAPLIEIDQVDGLAPAAVARPATGIALIHFGHDTPVDRCLAGAAGERYLLTSRKEGNTP
ncbi:MAG: hypothetical protein P8008_03705 [Gammaproteobacteria bacterium]